MRCAVCEMELKRLAYHYLVVNADTHRFETEDEVVHRAIMKVAVCCVAMSNHLDAADFMRAALAATPASKDYWSNVKQSLDNLQQMYQLLEVLSSRLLHPQKCIEVNLPCL